MEQDLFQGEAVLGLDLEALSDQVLAFGGEAGAEADVCAADLLIRLEWDVATDHVIQEDSQGPDGGGVSHVAAVADPFWRGVHACT